MADWNGKMWDIIRWVFQGILMLLMSFLLWWAREVSGEIACLRAQSNTQGVAIAELKATQPIEQRVLEEKLARLNDSLRKLQEDLAELKALLKKQ